MTNEEFNSWLEQAATIRCILVEATYKEKSSAVEKVMYFSNLPYNFILNNVGVTAIPLMVDGLNITESLSLDGEASISFGDIELLNDGSLDILLTSEYIWLYKPITIKLGSPDWDYADFRTIATGIINDVTCRAMDRINIQVRDNTQLLNKPIANKLVRDLSYYTETAADLTNDVRYPSLDEVAPIALGEVHNITPIQLDAGTLVYQLHSSSSWPIGSSAINGIIEVRDNGVPLAGPTVASPGYTYDLAKARLTLTNQPAGDITVSIQGDVDYVNSSGVVVTQYSNLVTDLIKLLAVKYGNIPYELVDGSSFNTAAYQKPAGVYIEDKANLLEEMQKLANSVGAYLYIDRFNNLRLVRLRNLAGIDPGTILTRITPLEIIEGTFSISDRVKPIAAVKLGYCRNYTVQDGLETDIPVAHKDLFSKEMLYVTDVNTSVASEYNVPTEVNPLDTYLITRSSAVAVATDLLNSKSVLRTIFEMEVVPKFLTTLLLGDLIVLQYDRFGLDNGKVGQIVSVSPDWNTGLTRIGVLVW